VPTLLLKLEQARKLQEALAELIPKVEAAARKEQEAEAIGSWDGDERRKAS
jgi:hypothetical protein